MSLTPVTNEALTPEDDEDSSHYEDAAADVLFFPKQLHPAVSIGMKRVSSCYFSQGSDESVADLLSQFGDDSTEEAKDCALLLFHDVLTNVFTFLDASSLAAFSQTARRPNFEVFYFFQLQLQRALLVNPNPTHHDQLASIAGVSCLNRLATLDLKQAQETVDDYLQSNSTLRTMPLSHSVAYLRHVLQRHGFQTHFLAQNSNNVAPSHALASAALFVTVVGTASLMAGDVDAVGQLFRVGFVGGLVKVVSDREQMRETAGQMARTVQNSLRQPRKFPRNLYEIREMMSANNVSKREALLSNPYDHLPPEEERLESKEEEALLEEDERDRRLPSGCVGAYSRVVQKATYHITRIVKERRKARFLALSSEEQRQISLSFLEACSSDQSLPLVEEMVDKVDVDGYYMGADGSETCCLHTAAFHGASRVLEFLCRGIDDSDGKCDGGLVDVNGLDGNGWTALHFAAGANAVEAVQVLARHGAELSIEANNGYTPLQWAIRLSNEEVVDALKDLIARSHENGEPRGWISSQPLTTLANRFFSLIPTAQH